jgi:hypothetical protein
MNRALEFHDSEVESIITDGDRVTVRFSEAYIHVSMGTPGVSPGDGFLQSAELVFSEASAPFPPNTHGSLSDGTIRVDGSSYDLLPLPFRADGKITAHLILPQVLVCRSPGAQCNAPWPGSPDGWRNMRANCSSSGRE